MKQNDNEYVIYAENENDFESKFEEYKFGPYAHSIEILSQQIKLFQNSFS